jgi:hypothetical protein
LRIRCGDWCAASSCSPWWTPSRNRRHGRRDVALRLARGSHR